MSRRIFATMLLPLLAAGAVLAQAPVTVPYILKAESPVTIDAVLNEWSFAFPITLNKTTEPKNGRTQKNFPVPNDVDCSGTIYMMWDVNNLYFAAAIKDTVPGAAGTAWYGDGIEIYLSNVALAKTALHGADHGATFYDTADGKLEEHLFVRYDAKADTAALIVFSPAPPFGGQVKSSGVVIKGKLNADKDGYFLEGRIAWTAIKSPTTGNTFNFKGGERVAATWSLIDIDTPLSSSGYGALQFPVGQDKGPNGNPGGPIWEVLDVRSGTPAAAKTDTVFTYINEPFAKRPDGPVTIDAKLDEWNFAFPITLSKATEPKNGRTQANFPIPNDVDGSGTMYMMWDDNNLYFAAAIKDTVPGAAGTAWYGDGIEIYLSSVPLVANALSGADHGATFYDTADGKYEVHMFVRYDAKADTTALIVFSPSPPFGGQVKSSGIVIKGKLNDDQDGYFLEGRIAWTAIKSPTTGNTFKFKGGERVPAQWSLIDIDKPLSSAGYGAIQLLKNKYLGPNGNPGGRVWNTLDFTGVSFDKQNQTTAVKDNHPADVVRSFNLEQNYPNPFNPSTEIKFTLDKTDNVSLKIYNIAGQLVQTVINNLALQPGAHAAVVDMSRQPSGVYFYTLRSGTRTQTKKMMFLK